MQVITCLHVVSFSVLASLWDSFLRNSWIFFNILNST